MDNSLKGLILSAGVVITCIVVGLGFYISREAKNTSNNGISQITAINSEFMDVDKTMYDGTKVSGREVAKVIEKYASELTNETISIIVYTGKKPESAGSGVLFNKLNTTVTTDVTSENYINPDASFLGAFITDDNGVVTKLTFTQQ
ncbi:MAG: hypothetical protein E7256_13170 [Lachnospiraceae bacterium]|nr:hypothetical protein [Lachnospiraceae bacterium]